jgi:hypothetical protein
MACCTSFHESGMHVAHLVHVYVAELGILFFFFSFFLNLNESIEDAV